MDSILKPEFVIQRNNISSIFYLSKFDYLLLSSNNGEVLFFSLETQRLLREFKTEKENLIFAAGILNQETSDDNFWMKIRILCHFKNGDIILYRISEDILDPMNNWQATFVCFAKCFMSLSHENFGFLANEGKKTSFNIVDVISLKVLELKFDSSSHGVISNSYYWYQKNDSIFVLLSDETGKLALYEHKIGTWNILVNKCSLSICKELILCFDFHQESKRGIAAGVKNEIILWSLDLSIFEFKENKRIKLPNTEIICCSIRQDGKIFSFACKDGQVRIMSFKTGKSLVSIPFHSSRISSMTFELIKNQYLLFVADNHTLLSVWSVYNNDENKKNVEKNKNFE